MTFSLPITPGSVSDKFVIHGSQTGTHPLSGTATGATVTLHSESGFLPGESVSVTALPGIQGAGSTQLDKTAAWQFRVGAFRWHINFTAGLRPAQRRVKPAPSPRAI